MSKLTIFAIEEQIKKHQQELKDLEHQLKDAKLESPDKQLATELHSMTCTWNHTDGCGWFYEFDNKKDNWLGHAHSKYLKQAQLLIHKCEQEGTTVEQVIAHYKLVKGL